MPKKLFKFQTFEPKTKIEDPLDNVEFIVHKFNNRPKPESRNNILIIGCFSEFGCEVIGSMYCIPRLLQKRPGDYTIAVGWHGREYLYRHLVDEFWEIKEEYQHLRDNAVAFGYIGKNLHKIEKKLKLTGKLSPTSYLGNIAVANFCPKCNWYGASWTWLPCCPKCNDENEFVHSLFSEPDVSKRTAIRIPRPSKEKMAWAKEMVGERPVAVFARGRKTYGRNLEPEFYVDVIEKLEARGYTPIWLGEKQSTLPCPVDHIVDFSRMEESRDLEKTLAIICQCEFTVQFWTASTRLAGIMGVPWLLFETPDQIYGVGQEGVRQKLTNFGDKKIVLCDFQKVRDNPKEAIELFDKAVLEVEDGDFKDTIGMVDNDLTADLLMKLDQYNLIEEK
jgi:hypothetical protein